MQEFKENDYIRVTGKQVFKTDDQFGTVLRVFTTSLKVQLNDGSKWFILKQYCTHAKQIL